MPHTIKIGQIYESPAGTFEVLSISGFIRCKVVYKNPAKKPKKINVYPEQILRMRKIHG